MANYYYSVPNLIPTIIALWNKKFATTLGIFNYEEKIILEQLIFRRDDIIKLRAWEWIVRWTMNDVRLGKRVPSICNQRAKRQFKVNAENETQLLRSKTRVRLMEYVNVRWSDTLPRHAILSTQSIHLGTYIHKT